MTEYSKEVKMKEFGCSKCNSTRFVVVHRHYTVADFSQEGAIEGHPAISRGGDIFDSIFCDNCSEPVEGETIQEMLREII